MCKRGNGKQRICIVLMMLLSLLVLVGCNNGHAGTPASQSDGGSSDKGQEEAGGRFLESEAALPDGMTKIYGIRRLEDDSMEVVAQDSSNAYWILRSTNKGEDWEQVRLQGKPDAFVPGIAIAPNGCVSFLGYAKNGTVDGMTANRKGKITKFSFDLPGQDVERQLRQSAYDSQGKLYILDTAGNVCTVDPSDGTCEKAFETDGITVNYFSAAGCYLFAVHDEGIILFDTKKEEVLAGQSVLDDLVKKDAELSSTETDYGTPMVFAGGEEEDRILYANKNGIFHFTMGGSVSEELADASLTSLGSGGLQFYDMAVWGEDEIFLAVNDGEDQNKILRYSYDQDAAAVPKQEITVYALEEHAFLRRAVTLFQKKYPDIHVNLEFGTSGKDGVTWKDALSVLNTNILAGKGPDVLILDGMPVESYIEKGVLVDISDVVEEVEQEDGIFTNIKEASVQDGKLYSMPVRFGIVVVEGDQKAVGAGGSLAALAKEAVRRGRTAEKSVLPEKGTMTLLRDLYHADSAAWKTESGTLDREALKEYLKCAKKLYDVDAHIKENDFMNDAAANEIISGGIKIGTLSGDGLLTGECSISFGTLSGISDFQLMVSQWKKTKADYCLMNHGRVKSWIPYLQAGVTAGENMETAKSFVKELLGAKAGNQANNGFPVNRAAYQKLCETKMDDPSVRNKGGIMFSKTDGDESYSFQYVNLTQKQVDTLTEQIEELEKPALADRVIREIVLEQGDKYLLGEQGLEETADAILKKVNLYLAE